MVHDVPNSQTERCRKCTGEGVFQGSFYSAPFLKVVYHVWDIFAAKHLFLSTLCMYGISFWNVLLHHTVQYEHTLFGVISWNQFRLKFTFLPVFIHVDCIRFKSQTCYFIFDNTQVLYTDKYNLILGVSKNLPHFKLFTILFTIRCSSNITLTCVKYQYPY